MFESISYLFVFNRLIDIYITLYAFKKNLVEIQTRKYNNIRIIASYFDFLINCKYNEKVFLYSGRLRVTFTNQI